MLNVELREELRRGKYRMWRIGDWGLLISDSKKRIIDARCWGKILSVEC
jgi:hypothetical protein